MPGQHHRGAEQRREPVGLPRPSVPRLGEVLEAGQGHETLAAALADHGGQFGQRGDVGQLVEGEYHRRTVPVVAFGRPGVRGPSDVVEQADHEGGHEGLVVGRRRHVDGVGRVHEGGGVEVGSSVAANACSDRKPPSAPDAVDQMPLSSRSSVVTMPSSTSRAMPASPAGHAGQCLLGGQRLTTVHPCQQRAHVGAFQGGGMQERGQQRLGPFRPVGGVRPDGTGAGRAHDTSERAVVRAVRHDVQAGSGDQRSRCTPGRSSTDPEGSNRWHVARRRSRRRGWRPARRVWSTW